MGVSTCVRPSHPVFSVKLERFLTVSELFKCQGIWRDDLMNPAALDAVLEVPAKGQDLAGNAFSSTVAQAQLIASLVHAQGWKSISCESLQLAALGVEAGGNNSEEHDSVEVGSVQSKRSSSFESTIEETSTKKRRIDDFWTPEDAGKRTRFVKAPAAPKFEACGVYNK